MDNDNIGTKEISAYTLELPFFTNAGLNHLSSIISNFISDIKSSATTAEEKTYYDAIAPLSKDFKDIKTKFKKSIRTNNTESYKQYVDKFVDDFCLITMNTCERLWHLLSDEHNGIKESKNKLKNDITKSNELKTLPEELQSKIENALNEKNIPKLYDNINQIFEESKNKLEPKIRELLKDFKNKIEFQCKLKSIVDKSNQYFWGGKGSLGKLYTQILNQSKNFYQYCESKNLNLGIKNPNLGVKNLNFGNSKIWESKAKLIFRTWSIKTNAQIRLAKQQKLLSNHKDFCNAVFGAYKQYQSSKYNTSNSTVTNIREILIDAIKAACNSMLDFLADKIIFSLYNKNIRTILKCCEKSARNKGQFKKSIIKSYKTARDNFFFGD